MRLSRINTRFSWKNVFALQLYRHRRCSVKKACKAHRRCFHVNIVKFLRTSILKNISERLVLKISTQLQIQWKEVIPETYDPFKPFIVSQILLTGNGFVMYHVLQWPFSSIVFFFQTYFYHKKSCFITHVKWDVIVSSSLSLLLKVWIWYRC